jgi:outer membrane protein TolC
MKKLFFALFYFTAAMRLSAQDTSILYQSFGQHALSLQECIVRSVEQSYALQILQNEEQIACNNYSKGNAGYLPNAAANAGLNDGRLWHWQGAGHSENYIVNAGIEWTAYDGGKRRYVYEWLRQTKDKGELATTNAAERLISEIITTYYDLLRRRISAANMQKSIILSRYRLQIAQEKFLLGACSRLEVLQAEVDLNADSSMYMVYMEETNQLKIRFKQHLRMPYEQDFDIADSIIPLRNNLHKEALQQYALANNISLQIYDKNRSLAALELKQIATEYNPTINLNAAYGYAGAPYGNGSQRLGLTYGATLGIKLYDGGSRNRRERNAKLLIDNRELEYQQLEHQVMADLNMLFSSYKNYLDLLQFETANSKLAEEKADLAVEQYQRGQLTGIEMREFQNTLLESQNRLVTAFYQAKYAEVKLLELCAMTSSYLSDESSDTAANLQAYESEVRSIDQSVERMTNKMETMLERWKKRSAACRKQQ